MSTPLRGLPPSCRTPPPPPPAGRRRRLGAAYPRVALLRLRRRLPIPTEAPLVPPSGPCGSRGQSANSSRRYSGARRLSSSWTAASSEAGDATAVYHRDATAQRCWSPWRASRFCASPARHARIPPPCPRDGLAGSYADDIATITHDLFRDDPRLLRGFQAHRAHHWVEPQDPDMPPRPPRDQATWHRRGHQRCAPRSRSRRSSVGRDVDCRLGVVPRAPYQRRCC